MKQCILLFSLLFIFYSKADARNHHAKDTSGRPALTFINNDTTYDFDGVPQGLTVENQFEIRNTGAAALAITAVTCESANIACKWPSKSIKPGKTGIITITYTAKGETGSFSNDIIITSNATETPYPFLHVKGAIIPEGDPYIPPARPAKNHGNSLKRNSQ